MSDSQQSVSPTQSECSRAGQDHDCEIEERIRAHGLVATPQRLEIGRLLLGEAQHVTAEQVIDKLTECGSSVSKATVYNTLGMFARVGLVRELFVDPTRVVYDSNVNAHHHLYNVDSGDLIDIELDLSQLSEQAKASLPAGVEMQSAEVVIRVRDKKPQR